MLKLRITTKRTAQMPMCDGTTRSATLTAEDSSGKLYALLQRESGGRSRAWGCDASHEPVECEINPPDYVFGVTFAEMSAKANAAVFQALAMNFEQMCAWYKENVGSDPREDGPEWTPSASALRHSVSSHIFWSSLPEGMDQLTDDGRYCAETFLEVVAL